MRYYDLQNELIWWSAGRLKTYHSATPFSDSHSQATKSFTIKEITRLIQYAYLVRQSVNIISGEGAHTCGLFHKQAARTSLIFWPTLHSQWVRPRWQSMVSTHLQIGLISRYTERCLHQAQFVPSVCEQGGQMYRGSPHHLEKIQDHQIAGQPL